MPAETETFPSPLTRFAGPFGLVVDGAGIEDYVAAEGLEFDARQIGAGDLQSVEKKAGGFAFELSGEGEAHDLHERDLDGVGVLKDGELDGGAAARASSIGVERNALFVIALVKVTELVAAEGGASALGAVDFDVLTSNWERKHGCLLGLASSS